MQSVLGEDMMLHEPEFLGGRARFLAHASIPHHNVNA